MVLWIESSWLELILPLIDSVIAVFLSDNVQLADECVVLDWLL